MHLLLLNGPNLNLLGRARDLWPQHPVDDRSGSQEGSGGLALSSHVFKAISRVLVDKIHAAMGSVHGILINAGAYTHTSPCVMPWLVWPSRMWNCISATRTPANRSPPIVPRLRCCGSGLRLRRDELFPGPAGTFSTCGLRCHDGNARPSPPHRFVG